MYIPESIVIKQVMGEDGDVSHLELWQNERYIKLSLSNATTDIKPINGKWEILKKQVDALVKENPYSPESIAKNGYPTIG